MLGVTLAARVLLTSNHESPVAVRYSVFVLSTGHNVNNNVRKQINGVNNRRRPEYRSWWRMSVGNSSTMATYGKLRRSGVGRTHYGNHSRCSANGGQRSRNGNNANSRRQSV